MIDTVIEGIDYGPLAAMVGLWKGDKGMDVAPESDGTIEENPFFEELLIEAAGDLSNADKQKLAILRYSQKVYRKSNNEQFHDQIGYWLWDPDEQTVMHTLSIPRGVALVAGGTAVMDGDRVEVNVKSEEGGDWGVAQSPFMRDNARTESFTMAVTIEGDRMSYSETTLLDIYGRKFDHTDNSVLERVTRVVHSN